jgi:mono/diheme cytochrome c family protein
MNNTLKLLGFFVMLTVIFSSCQSASGNQTGSEYMPDMAHSVAYEANTFGYYYHNRWGTDGRGVSYKANGSVPYYYANTEEDRARATAEIINNPYPITTSGLEKGKTLYNIQCGICHGEKADGNGYLVREDGGKYPAQPANFMLDEFVAASNGRYYHAIMHGKNVMGGYSDKLSYDERWYVIQYIRSLQAAAKKLEYSENANTFNTTDTPYSVITAKKAAEAASVAPVSAPAEAAKAESHNNSGH